MRYNSESLEIKVVISGNGLLYKDIKISLGLLITVRKMHDLFQENLRWPTSAHRIQITHTDTEFKSLTPKSNHSH